MSQPPAPPARRREPRALCSQLVEVSFLDQRGRRVVETALLEDLARSGARLSLTLPLTPGNRVVLNTPGFEATAHVRYCEPAESGYAAGLKFVDGTQWEESKWSPQHLLKIRTRETAELTQEQD